MATSPVTLLDAVDAVGFGSIIDLGIAPIRFIGFSVEPSSDAQIDSVGTVGEGILIQSSLSATFPQPAEGHQSNYATTLIDVLPLFVENPEGNPAPQALVRIWLPVVREVVSGQLVVYPYIRAKLLSPLDSGTVTVKFHFGTT